MPYDRWTPVKKNSYPYIVFKQYNQEIKRMMMSYESAKKFTYTNLTRNGADWLHKANLYLETKGDDEITIEDWSKVFNKYDNWHRLNCLMAMSSYFETFLASIVKLALESDPGTFIGVPHSIDGVQLFKQMRKPFKKQEIEKLIQGCTKGDWASRQNSYKRLFGSIPHAFSTAISDLEKIRKLRNNVGHAFGRDIRKSRDYSISHISLMNPLASKTLYRFHRVIEDCAKDINEQLMNEHIGNYHPLLIYHNNKDILNGITINETVKNLKKMIGKEEQNPYSKEFCTWVVDYYSHL